MSDINHTPTPWKCYRDTSNKLLAIVHEDARSILQAKIAITGYNRHLCAVLSSENEELGFFEQHDIDIAFMLRACNHHDELVGMVECAIAAMDGEWGGDSQIVARHRAQLAKIASS